MRRVISGGLSIEVAADLASWISTACTEFANNGQSIAVPIVGYIDGAAASAELVVGQGISLAIIDGDPDDPRPEPPRALEALVWIRDEVEALQQAQNEANE